MSSSKHPIGIIGAGTMGAGIAQVAATAGWTVFLMDMDAATVQRAIESIEKRLDRLVEKDMMTSELRGEVLQRINIATDADGFAECDLVIEAIVEDLAVKAMVLTRVAKALNHRAVIASNTSSLSISKIGEAIGQPQRVVGMHFFNPAPIMPLVEIIAGNASSVESIERATLIAEACGKTVVKCSDTPGFIVNRVARPYYLEAFRVLEDGYASAEDLDKIMKELGGFRMGPLELTDLIGQDVNAATTTSLYEQLGRPARLRPSKLQMQLVNDGQLGRKTGRGVFNHQDGESLPPMQVPRKQVVLNDRLQEAVDRFVERASDQIGTAEEQYVFARILVSIINEAAWALTEKVASAADIDTAMKLGTNYPKGPLEWADEIGYGTCGALLDVLNTSVEQRFEAPDMLKASV